MEKLIKKYIEEFDQIGNNGPGLGYTRLAYTDVEDAMHQKLISLAQAEGLLYSTDEVGNTYIYQKDYESYYLIGSHLDSVIQAGAYDGVLGVVVGLAILKKFKDQGLDIKLKLVAFRAEESTNFMYATLGSKLITGKLSLDTANGLVDRQGQGLAEIFEKRDYKLDPPIITGAKEFIELHIEQGRVLEDRNLQLGIVDVIAGSSRLNVDISGLAGHSGANPMDLRKDSLAGAAQIISYVEEVAGTVSKTGVATVGYIKNEPNSMNVIPGRTKFSVDIRDIHTETMEEMTRLVKDKIDQVCTKRGLDYKISQFPLSPAVHLSKDLGARMEVQAQKLGLAYQVMASGAGHDCMNMADICDSILIFIPCKEGISHNPLEAIDYKDAGLGAQLIYEYLKEASHAD